MEVISATLIYALSAFLVASIHGDHDYFLSDVSRCIKGMKENFERDSEDDDD